MKSPLVEAIKRNRLILEFLLLCFFILGVLSPFVWAETLLEKPFQLRVESEVLLDLVASAPGTSWGTRGSEAAVVTMFIDGRYHQDVILFAGSQMFTYSVALGRLTAGGHALRVEFNRKQSASSASVVRIQDAKISSVEASNSEYQATAHAPILYARPNSIGRFTDIPLLMWYETKREPNRTSLSYSVIFTNEDGGTETNALMARWGRATDIEWVYEVTLNADGRVVEETFQSVSHRTQPFRGKKEADHPVLIVASDNNNFSDNGTSEMRFALRPIPFDLSQHAREEIMDRHPWTYRIMAEELQREGKIGESKKIGQHIADPRQYLYLEAGAEQRDTALSFAVKLKDNPRWHTSHVGIGYFRIERSGYFRTAIHLPTNTTLDQIEEIVVCCEFVGDVRLREDASKLLNAECHLTAVNKIFLLDQNWRPGLSLPINVPPQKLQFGDMVQIYGDPHPLEKQGSNK